jgi:segregation and condensation protein A
MDIILETMEYDLRLENYEGPIDKLLELVEEKKLEITQISLAKVTADFLEFLKKIEAENKEPALISDFLVIASKLILIKSKAILPDLKLTEEEEADIKDLENRLKIYQEFKEAKDLLKKNWSILPQMISREYLKGLGSVFYPPQNFNLNELKESLDKLLSDLEKILQPTQTIKTEIISLKAKIEEVMKRLKEKPLTLRSLHNQGSRRDLIVLFLAILHLVKEQLVRVEQNRHFEEIKIAKLAEND